MEKSLSDYSCHDETLWKAVVFRKVQFYILIMQTFDVKIKRREVSRQLPAGCVHVSSEAVVTPRRVGVCEIKMNITRKQ